MSFAVVSSTLNWLQHININRDGYYTRSDEKWKIFLRFSPVSLNHQLISITPDRQRKWDRTRFPLIDYYYFCLCFFLLLWFFVDCWSRLQRQRNSQRVRGLFSSSDSIFHNLFIIWTIYFSSGTLLLHTSVVRWIECGVARRQWHTQCEIKNKSWTKCLSFCDNKTICTHMHGNGWKPTECILFAASHDFGRNIYFIRSFDRATATVLSGVDVCVSRAQHRIGAHTVGFHANIRHTHTHANCHSFRYSPFTSLAYRSQYNCVAYMECTNTFVSSVNEIRSTLSNTR